MVQYLIVDKDSCVIYSGSIFTLEWYYDKNGKSVGYEYFQGITQEQRRKFLTLQKEWLILGKYLIKLNS
jgi:hypothetical protein